MKALGPVVDMTLDVHSCYVQHRSCGPPLCREKCVSLGPSSARCSSARFNSGPSVVQQFQRCTPRTMATWSFSGAEKREPRQIWRAGNPPRRQRAAGFPAPTWSRATPASPRGGPARHDGAGAVQTQTQVLLKRSRMRRYNLQLPGKPPQEGSSRLLWLRSCWHLLALPYKGPVPAVGKAHSSRSAAAEQKDGSLTTSRRLWQPCFSVSACRHCRVIGSEAPWQSRPRRSRQRAPRLPTKMRLCDVRLNAIPAGLLPR